MNSNWLYAIFWTGLFATSTLTTYFSLQYKVTHYEPNCEKAIIDITYANGTRLTCFPPEGWQHGKI